MARLLETRADDPGDDTQRRYRYQNTIAAIEAAALLEEDLVDIEAVYCEFHEDLLVVSGSGKSAALAVKTRSATVPYKATDEEIISACNRFATLDQLFGAEIEKFVIVGSVGFHDAETKSSLPYLIRLATAASDCTAFASNGKAKPFIERVCTNGVSVDDLYSVLQRIELQDGPKLDGAHAKLEATLLRIPLFKKWQADAIPKLASRLVQLAHEAASLSSEDDPSKYVSSGGGNRYIGAILGKKIDRDRVLKIVEEIERHAEFPESAVSGTTLSLGTTVFEGKLSLGGFDIDHIANAKRQKEAAEALFLTWRTRHRASEAVIRARRVNGIVQNAIVEARDEFAVPEEAVGLALLRIVRSKLRTIAETRAEDVYNMRYEDLLGVAAILTEQCDVWWSNTRTLPEAS